MAAFQPKKLSELHKDALRMMAAGFRGKQISESTGLSKWHLSRVRNSELGKQFRQELGRRIDEITIRHLVASWFAQPMNPKQRSRKGA